MSLVRVRVGDREFNVGSAYAQVHKLTVLDDEPTHNRDGSVREETRVGGRPVKPRTSVAAEAAKKTSARKPRAAKKTAAKKTATAPKAAKSAEQSDTTTPSKES